MKHAKKLMSLFLTLAIILIMIPAAGAAGNTITVSTGDELSQLVESGNIPDGATIYLPSDRYVLPDGCIYFKELYEVKVIGNGKTMILSNDLADMVIAIIDCSNIQFHNLSLGHIPPTPGTNCQAGVVLIENSNTEIDNCGIFGCGQLGISAEDSLVGLRNSAIYDCSWNAIVTQNCDFYADNCSFYGNGKSNISIYEGLFYGPMTIENSFIYNNIEKTVAEPLYGDPLAVAELINCTFYGNSWGGDNTSFADLKYNHWAQANITRASNLGILNGMGDGTFQPESQISNAQFAALLTRSFFKSDVASAERAGTSPWYKPNITVATTKGLLNGTKLGFGAASPDDNISRYDMAMMVYNLLSVSGKLPPQYLINDAGQGIEDGGLIPDSYQNAVFACYAANLITGKNGGFFCGDDPMTRAEAATIMLRVIDYING